MGGEAALEWLWSESFSKSNLKHNQLSFEARCLNKSGGGFSLWGFHDPVNNSVSLWERERARHVRVTFSHSQWSSLLLRQRSAFKKGHRACGDVHLQGMVLRRDHAANRRLLLAFRERHGID